jgi:hypothetical protein
MNRAYCRIMRDDSYRNGAPSSDEVKAKIVEDLKAGMMDESTTQDARLDEVGYPQQARLQRAALYNTR